jgi:NifC-like ABC-type porter/molybdate ABC transporter, permease protein
MALANRDELRLPPLLRLMAAVAALTIILPIAALLWCAQWGTFFQDIATSSAMSALQLSFVTAFITTAICLLFGIPLAFYLARSNTWLATVIRVLINLPLVMPPLVGGLALLMLFGRRGIIGGPIYDATGFLLPFSTPAVVVAQVFVAMPFMVISVEGVLRGIDPSFASTASSLGATPWTVLRRVVLPLARPGLLAGAVLTFARALGEFGATALFAGNREGITQTMPLAIYTAFNGGGVSTSAAIALAILLMAAAFGIMIATKAWYPKKKQP